MRLFGDYKFDHQR